MRNNRLQNRMTAGRWTLPITIIICIFCWGLSTLLLPGLVSTAGQESGSMLWQSVRIHLVPGWVEHLLSMLIYALIGYFLIELNYQYSIIRLRASVQTSIYFLLITVCPEMHLLYAGDVAAIAFLISIYFLFKSYQVSHSSSYLFYSFLFIGAGSLLFPQLTFFSLLWFIEAFRFQSLNPRSFCAALFGWAIPYWFLLGHAFFYGQMEMFYHPFRELITFDHIFDFGVLLPWQLATLAFLLLLFIVSAAHCVVAGYEDKIRSRVYLQFLINVTLFIFLLIAFQPSYCSNLMPILLIPVSILTGHLFALTNSRSSNFFFILVMLGLVLLFAFNIWTLL